MTSIAAAAPQFLVEKLSDSLRFYEQRLGSQEGFWPKFAYVLIKKLADVSVDKKLPAIFA